MQCRLTLQRALLAPELPREVRVLVFVLVMDTTPRLQVSICLSRYNKYEGYHILHFIPKRLTSSKVRLAEGSESG